MLIQENWAPACYRPHTAREREMNYGSPDVHRAVMTSILYHHPGITQAQVAVLFSQTIHRLNAGGWGRRWQLTRDQMTHLATGNFELAWRAIDESTVAAFGV